MYDIIPEQLLIKNQKESEEPNTTFLYSYNMKSAHSPSKKLYSYCKQNINYDKNIYSYYLKLHPMCIFKYPIIHHATASKGHPPSSQLLQIFHNQPK